MARFFLTASFYSPPLRKARHSCGLRLQVGGDVMRKAILGRTGLEISELVLGGGVTGGILINADEATRFNALRRAVMGGINWIDTAPIYGNGASEETIGRHIESLTPRPQISTKVRLETEDMDNIPSAILRSLEASLTRLAGAARRAVPASQSHRHHARRPRAGDGGAGARPRRHCRYLRPSQVAWADRRRRADGGGRHPGLSRGDQQRALRRRAGLLQRDQSQRRLDPRAARSGAGRTSAASSRPVSARTWAC